MHEEIFKKFQILRKSCLDNAECLLSMAERELGRNADHICFHLALLAFEEVGKAGFATVSFAIVTGNGNVKQMNAWMEDHEKKIFWAFWRPTSDTYINTREEIENSDWIATALHKRRLLSLYTDPNNPVATQDRMKEEEARQLIQLVRVRLEMEKQTIMKDHYTEEDTKMLSWFFEACEDEEKKRFIFGNISMQKRIDLKDGKSWIIWLREYFDKKEAEFIKTAEQEISRKQPDAAEAEKPKYQVRIRIQTQSHEIANKAFKEWNEKIDRIKLQKSNSKQMKPFAKGEVLMDFILPKAVPLSGLWDFSFFKAKTFVIALNIASKGLFWWNVPKDIEAFYENAKDLESMTNFKLTRGKRVSLDWNSANLRLILDAEVMGRVSVIFGYIINEHEKLKQYLTAYAEGMGLFSKTDIHLRLDANAFERFFLALKEALVAHGDWDGKEPLVQAAKKQFPEELNELKETLELGLAQENDPTKPHNITLTEVAAIKLYCDFYLEKKAFEYINREVPPKEL